MNSNLFNMEMRRNLSLLLIWVLIITALIVLTMSVFRTFLENQSKITGLLAIIPKGALQFKGISNLNDLMSALGFYAVNNVIYMMVLGSIFGIVLGSGILLKEEYNRTAEYLLARPMTRAEVFLSKFAVMFLCILLLNFITSVAGFISLRLAAREPFRITSFLVLSLNTFLLNLLFGTLGLFISTLVRRSRPITFSSIGIVMIMYFIYTISKITKSAAAIGYVSPFKFADIDVMRADYKVNLPHLAYFTGFALLFSVLSFIIYRRKDIYI